MPKSPYQSLKLIDIHEPPEPLRLGVSVANIEELATSLETHGLLQPILVRPSSTGYEIIAGHRRYLAAIKNGWSEIEAKILPKGTEDVEILSLAENVHRENLTPIEEARLIRSLVIEQARDVDTVARRFGKSRAWVDTRLAIADYPDDLKTAIHAGQVSLSSAKELVRVNDEGYRGYLIEQATLNGCSAQTARLWADDWHRTLQHTGQTPTAGDRPPAEYAGQTVGVSCTGCAQLHPIARLRPFYFCLPCADAIIHGPAPPEPVAGEASS